MINFSRGDVVVVDLGMTQKVRPCVVVSISNPDRQRNMSVVVPMTTEIRGGDCEVSFAKPAWLKSESVVNVLGVAGVDNAKVIKRIGQFPVAKFQEITWRLAGILGLEMEIPPVSRN
jgi:mRNA interferase MazF